MKEVGVDLPATDVETAFRIETDERGDNDV